MANMKYCLEKREQVAQYVLKRGKPASSVAKVLGIGINSIQVSVATKNLFFGMTERSCGR